MTVGPALRHCTSAATFAVLSALASACPLHAQEVRGAGDYLARMDVDGDHRASPAEYQAWMGYAFDAMDRDHDGVLSTGELPGGHGSPITREAHRARLAAAFVRQDRDRDGFLDARELAAPPR